MAVSPSQHAEEMGRVSVAPWVEHAIRRDERLRLADLLDNDRAVLFEFVKDGAGLLKLISWLLRLDGASGGEKYPDESGGRTLPGVSEVKPA